MQIYDIPIGQIHIDDDFNCRGAMAPIDVEDLAIDIKEHGLMQPVIVYPYNEEESIKTGFKYKLVAGYRRTYAHKVLKRETIPAVIRPHMTEVDASVLNLSENLKRKDLNIMQEAKAIERLYKLGIGREQASRLIGKTSGWVDIRFQVLKFPPEVQNDVAAGLINQFEVMKLAKIKNQDKLFETVRKLKDAKAKGERIDRLLTRNKPKPHEKKVRKPNEMFDMMDIIIENLGYGWPTRILAWCAGEISDIEIFEDLKQECIKHGKTFVLPRNEES